jgi:hypothetical protein
LLSKDVRLLAQTAGAAGVATGVLGTAAEAALDLMGQPVA